MSEPRPIAIARTWAEMTDGMAAAVSARKITNLDLDAAAGLAEGHTGKIFAGTKNYGEHSFDAHTACLGAEWRLFLVHEPRITSTVKKRMADAKSRLAARARTREGRELIAEMMRKVRGKAIGEKISKGIMRRMTPDQRRRRAQQAARAGWAKGAYANRSKNAKRPQSCQAPKHQQCATYPHECVDQHKN